MADFNTEPFFDDYNEDDKFYRILFRPGYAVQARELTQMQTILQEQVRRHGDHIFKEGSMVIPGQVSYDLSVPYVKLVTDPAIDAKAVLEQLVGKEIQNSAGLTALVVNYALAETVNGNFEENTLFLKYQNSVQDLAGNNIQNFTVNDYLSPTDGSVGLNVTVADTGMPFGFGCSASIQRGIYYINKNFVLVTEQSIILDKYTNSPSYRIGLKMVEDIIYPDDDEQLLDNALGSPNYAAPGAARYKIDLVLTKITENPDSVTITEEEDFIDVLRLRNGNVVFKLDRSNYAELEKTLARRTYDESGDYTLNPFRIQVKDYRNNFRGGWAAGEKYIQGDLIRVSDGSAFGSNYFVSITNGTSGGTTPDFNNWASLDYFDDNTVRWEYVHYPNFNQGVHTFNSGDSDFTNFSLDDHIRLDGTLALGIEAGKAYVRGYEIEKISTEYLPVPKCRYLPEGSAALSSYFGVPSLPADDSALSGVKTTNIDMSIGNYVIAEKVKRAPDLLGLGTVNLHSVIASSANTGTIIGTARVRGVETHLSDVILAGSFVIGETYTITAAGTTDFVNIGAANNLTGTTFIASGPGAGTGSARAYTYKVFLFDIVMNGGKNFTSVKSIYNAPTMFMCDMIQVDNKTTLENPEGSSLIYSLPDYAIADIFGASYTVVAPMTQSTSDNTLSFTAPAGYAFASANDDDNYIIINNASGAFVRITPIVSSGGGTLTISGVENQSHTVLTSLIRSANNVQTFKALTDADPMQLNTQAAAQAKTITLNHSFVTRIVSVTMSNQAWGTASPVYSTNITERYRFDQAQSSSVMALSTITLVPGATAPTGPIMIKYEYVTTTQSTLGDFTAVNSYIHANSKIRYDQIPPVSSYSLRDSIDFRPYAVGAGFQQRYFPKFGSTASISYRNYLSRTDSVALSTSGRYIVANGVPAEIPIEQTTPSMAMKIARVSVEPYTFRYGDQTGVIVTPVENKRYTMRDIGKLERRIQDLEYYTALTLTELDTKNMRIVDSNGFERYQNGFLVDSFDGQGIGNASSDDWNASIDSSNKELRPFFSQKQVNLLENRNATIKNYKVSGDLVTLPFTEVDMITQSKASTTESVNPYAVYSWKGVISINPWSDTWFSTHRRPDIILNDESQYNAIVSKAEEDGVLGTVWNSWQTAFSSTKSLGDRLQNIGAWSTANNQILNSTNNGGSFWRNRATFTVEERELIGGTGTNVNTGVAGSRILTIETQATETTAVRSGTRSFIVDKVDSRVLEDRVVDTRIVPYIRPRAVLFIGYGFRPATNMYAFFDNVNVNSYIQPAIRIKIDRVIKTGTTFYPHRFDIERNCGSNVSNRERTVLYSTGDDLSGTVTVSNGSSTIVGLATAFMQQVQVGDKINFGIGPVYTVASITDNYTLTLTSVYSGASSSDVSCSVIPGDGRNTEEVEIAFNHGEVIKEINGNGNTAIVVGQEVIGSSFYIYVLNIKGSGNFSTAPGAYIEGEYSVGADKPRVKFLEKTVHTSLKTSETGLLCGIFNIPSNPLLKFRTGTRELTFSDSQSVLPSTRSDQESTSGGAIYEANGLIEVMQRTIIATRTANIVSEQVSATNTIVTTTDRLTRDTGWYDPLAQTFLVQQEGGAFITSADVYFSQKDERIPVRVEVREVVNGYPGSVVLPFSRVEKKSSEVITSSDSSIPTTFTFGAPVFLQNGIEYALVILSDSSTYRLWISETLGIDQITGKIINSQPYSGVLFKSQNASTWTADQTQDLKFKLRRAQFSQTPVSLELIPPKLAYKNLGFNPLNFITGSKKCRVVHPDHGMISGEYVILKSRQVINSINGIAATNIFDRPHQILSAELDSYVIEFPGAVNSTATGQVGGGYLVASENYEFATAMLEIGEVVPPGTSIEYVTKVIDHSDTVSEHRIVPKENFTFSDVKVYPSEANYTSTSFPSGLSVVATLRPHATSNSLSPVIDLGRAALTMVSNKVDNPTLEINDSTLDYFPIGTSVEIGDGKALDLIDLNDDTVMDTLVVDSLTATTLYNNMNNNLNSGDVIKFTYSGITDAERYMVITEKYQENTQLFFTLMGFSGETVMETTTGQSVDLVWLSHFKSEYASVGGSTHSKYVTKKINFNRPSEMLKIMFAALIPTEAEVEIYYKTGIGVSEDFIASSYRRAMPSSYNKSSTEFNEVSATVEDLEPFDSVMIKLVMKSINKAAVPRIQDFRVIACAA